MIRFLLSAVVVFGVWLLVNAVTTDGITAFNRHVSFGILAGLTAGAITYRKMRK
jgi:hypothetical protein